MAIKLSDPFIPVGGVWYQYRGFAAHKRGWGGIDYSFYNNSLILAVFPGKIILQRYEKGGFGHRIDLRSSEDPRYTAVYAHNYAKIVVKTGKSVIRGQLIKYSDNSGASTGPHLHLTILFNGRAVDPAKLPWKIYNYKEPQKPKEVKVAEQWYTKDIRAKAAEIANLKKAVKSKATEISNLKKSIKQIEENHDTEIERMKTEYTKCRGRGTKLVNEIDTLKIKVQNLKDKIKTFEEPKGVKLPRVTKTDGKWSRFWKPLIRAILSYKTKK